jgi:hypothetical protein
MYYKPFTHNVIFILRKFSRQEIRKFKKFIYSPYFNEHKIVTSLFNEIVKYYPEFCSRQLTKDNLKALISPTGSESTFRDVLSILLRLLLKFITIEKFCSQKFPMNNLILKSLTEKNMFTLFEKEYDKIKQDIEAVKSNSLVEYFMNSFNIGLDKYSELVINRNKKFATNNEILILSDNFSNLFNHFLLQSFRIYYDLSIYMKANNLDIKSLPVGKFYSSNLIIDLINVIKINKKYNYVVEIYRTLWEFDNKQSSDSYQLYKKIVKLHSAKMNKDELMFHCLELINYCVKKGTEQVENMFFAKELFDLYRFFLKHNLYMNMNLNRRLLPELYLNIIINSIKLKKINWMKKFIEDYADEITEEEIGNMKILSFALLYNALNDFDKSLMYARKIKEKDKISIKIKRVIIIRNYYELDLLDEAFKEIINFRAVMRRNQLLSNVDKEKLYKFLKYTETLLSLKISGSKENINELINRIKNFEHSWFYKDWLLNKTMALKN